jgi:hypothetical protein
MTKFPDRPTVVPQPILADYEPPRLEVLGSVDELTMGGMVIINPDGSPIFGSVSDRHLKERISRIDGAAVLDRALELQPTGYTPPRLEVLGTVEELTMGFAAPVTADNTTFLGSVSDRRLKGHFAPVDPHSVLERCVG